jgi:hypothetical protein
MTRCDHRGASITEKYEYSIEHRERDGEWSSRIVWSPLPASPVKVTVGCMACGLCRDYYGERPKWLIERIKEIHGLTYQEESNG